MVSALARIFKGSDVLVTPSISLLISAKTWLRKMFLMYTVRKSRRGHCLAGPSPRACSISWINLEDNRRKQLLNVSEEYSWKYHKTHMGISSFGLSFHGEVRGDSQNSFFFLILFYFFYFFLILFWFIYLINHFIICFNISCFAFLTYFTNWIKIGQNRKHNF